MKEVSDDNWERARTQIAVGIEVSGEVEATRPFGVFVKLDLGPTALLLVTRFRHPPLSDNDYPKPGDKVTAFVDVIDDQKRQIGLTQIKPATEGHALSD